MTIPKAQPAQPAGSGFDYSPDDMRLADGESAVCWSDVNKGYWYPEDFSYAAKEQATVYAKAGCARCPLRLKCLSFSIKADERFGIYGGLTADERRALVDGAAA